MASCTDNDKRWSHGQPFTIILDLRDGIYPVENFRDAEVVYEAEDANEKTHIAVWRLIKAIRHSPDTGYVTAVLQAVDPLLSASGHGVEPIGPAKKSHPPFTDTVSGPVATFDSSGSSSSSSASMQAGKGKRAIGGASSSSGSSISSATTLTTVRVQFSFVGGKEPVKV